MTAPSDAHTPQVTSADIGAQIDRLSAEIDALREENKRLRTALEKIDGNACVEEPSKTWTSRDPDDAFHEGYCRATWEAAQIAREALATEAA